MLYSERPRAWNWQDVPALGLRRDDGRFHLSKFDDRSAFSPEWVIHWIKGASDRVPYSGIIFRYDAVHLKLVQYELQFTRLEHVLSEANDSWGLVGIKINELK